MTRVRFNRSTRSLVSGWFTFVVKSFLSSYPQASVKIFAHKMRFAVYQKVRPNAKWNDPVVDDDVCHVRK